LNSWRLLVTLLESGRSSQIPHFSIFIVYEFSLKPKVEEFSVWRVGDGCAIDAWVEKGLRINQLTGIPQQLQHMTVKDLVDDTGQWNWLPQKIAAILPAHKDNGRDSQLLACIIEETILYALRDCPIALNFWNQVIPTSNRVEFYECDGQIARTGVASGLMRATTSYGGGGTKKDMMKPL
ncbi:hypothetical protein A2U01_0003380, partial [Trifolium medium]|nr:hypothetical protein [Trifolium medium]